MYIDKRKVEASSIGHQNIVRIKDLVDYIQDVEANHIDGLTELSHEAKTYNMAIVLTYRFLKINYWPKYKEQLILKTYPYETKPFYGYRNTIVYDEHERPVVESYCVGFFMNLDTYRPHRISEQTLKSIRQYDKYDMQYFGRKIIEPNNLKLIKEVNDVVLISDLDYYQHMNNAIYVLKASNHIPQNFIYQYLICEYLDAYMLNDTIHIKVYESSQGYYVNFYDQKQTLKAKIAFLKEIS